MYLPPPDDVVISLAQRPIVVVVLFRSSLSQPVDCVEGLVAWWDDPDSLPDDLSVSGISIQDEASVDFLLYLVLVSHCFSLLSPALQ